MRKLTRFALPASLTGVVAAGVFLLSALAPPAEMNDTAFTLWGGFANPDQSFDLVYLSGQRVQRNGLASFAGSYATGATIGGSSGAGLADPMESAVFLTLRAHGEFDPTIADEQITTMMGGCDVATCYDQQYAVFFPDGNTEQSAPVLRTLDDSLVEGAWATLQRAPEGITYAIHTRLR